MMTASLVTVLLLSVSSSLRCSWRAEPIRGGGGERGLKGTGAGSGVGRGGGHRPTRPEARDGESALGNGGLAVVHFAEHLEPEEGQFGTGHVELQGPLAPCRVQSIVLCRGQR